VLLLCFSAPLVHLILRRTGLFLHSRCTLLIAHPPQLHPHRPSGFRRRTALCRSYRRCFLFYDHTDGISTRPIRISHGTHRGCRHIATDFPCVLCIVMHPPRIFFGSHSRTDLQFALYLKWISFVPISRCLWTLRTGLPFAEAGYARFFTGRSLMVANDGHHTRRRTFHAVSFGAFAVG
jgi:hypothetical protein